MGDIEHIKQLEEKNQFLEIQLKHIQNDLRLTKEEYEISTKNFFDIYSNIEKEVEARIKDVKKLQAVLKAKAQELQIMLDSSPGIIFYKDANHRYLRVNKIFSETIGVPIRKIIGKTYDKLFPDDTNHIFSDDAEVIQTGNPILNESIMIETVNGKRQILINKIPYKDIDGRIVGIVGFGTDITDLVEAEESLRQSEEIHRIVTDSVWDSILIVQDAKVKWANKIALAKVGYSEDEIIGIEIKKLFHPDDLPLAIQRYQDRMSGIPVENPSYLRVITKEGKILEAENRGAIITWKGRPASVQTLKDITEEKRKEEERKKLETQLQQSQKMESIGTLAGGIAHDFNNILSPIMIHAEMVMMDLPPESPLQQNMKQLYKAAERARNLVKQILTFARKQDKERISIKISQILKEAIKLLRSSIPTTVDIQYDINPEQDTVLSDPVELNQIIMNLCTNAAHAMEDDGGTLEVTLTNENLDSGHKFSDLEPGRYVKLTVKDNGHGIEPQFMDKIFEPYFTTKEVGKGTGMGLALIHGIVKSYGGAVTVQSEVDKGTSFHVYLPLVEDDKDVLETPQDSVQLPRGTERVLFVDDEKDAVDAFQPMLASLGYKVTARTSSIEALEAFRNKPDSFDLVITDMTMPNMTGKDLAKELMGIRPDIPIILCTGFSEKIDRRRATEMGISAFVMKPIVMGQIANTIREVLDGK